MWDMQTPDPQLACDHCSHNEVQQATLLIRSISDAHLIGVGIVARQIERQRRTIGKPCRAPEEAQGERRAVHGIDGRRLQHIESVDTSTRAVKAGSKLKVLLGGEGMMAAHPWHLGKIVVGNVIRGHQPSCKAAAGVHLKVGKNRQLPHSCAWARVCSNEAELRVHWRGTKGR